MSLDMQVNASLKPFNSFGVDVKASLFAQAHNDDDVRQALLCAAEHKLPLLVIGVLFTFFKPANFQVQGFAPFGLSGIEMAVSAGMSIASQAS